jgi:carboxyl-terminal processing protease
MKTLIFLLLLTTCDPVNGQPLKKQSIEHLAALGKVWGFLKYYHPLVAQGKYNWDTTLVTNYQKAILAKDKNELNLILLHIINSAGPVTESTDAKPILSDSLKKNLNIIWMNDTSVFLPIVSKRLQHIYNNYKPTPNYYIQRNKAVGNPIFPNEPLYDVPLPSPEYRFLALCRFWNVINYYYPYKYMIHYAWDSLFIEFTPRLINTPSYYQYFRIMQQMTSKVNDGHIMVSSTFTNMFADRRLLPFKIRKLQGVHIVSSFVDSVKSVNAGVHIGDTITSLDGLSVEILRKHHNQFQSASNDNYLQSRIDLWMPVVKTNPALVGIKKSKDTVKVEVNTLKTPYHIYVKPLKYPYFAINDSVGYIHMGQLKPTQVDSAFITLGHKPYLIFDCRYYPNWTVYPLGEKLLSKRFVIAQINEPDYRYPGIIKWVKPMYAGKPNTTYYKGTVIALISEETMSQGELTAMTILKAPKSISIGTQTAGACGDVSTLPLPGGIEVLISGLGYYFPDYSPLQQHGIHPDIEVKPTIKDIVEGKDEIMERALEFIGSGK